jgi:hypothetical protein
MKSSNNWSGAISESNKFAVEAAVPAAEFKIAGGTLATTEEPCFTWLSSVSKKAQHPKFTDVSERGAE